MAACSVTGCDRPVVARGWCSTHYARWSRTGRVGDAPIRDAGKRLGRCSIDACDKKAVGRDLCMSHYDRWRRYGDPLGSRKRNQTPFSAERRANIASGLRRHHASVGSQPHPADCGHCLAVRGAPKPPRSGAHNDRISATRRTLRDPNYYSLHRNRLRRDRGRPSDFLCSCGKPAQQWALRHDADPVNVRIEPRNGSAYSIVTADYVAMCISCHRRMDLAHAATPTRSAARR